MHYSKVIPEALRTESIEEIGPVGDRYTYQFLLTEAVAWTEMLPPPMKLREGNISNRVCLSVQAGILCDHYLEHVQTCSIGPHYALTSSLKDQL